MNAVTLKTLATSTADTFRDEFPGAMPSIEWLAEAAAIDRIPDAQRDAYGAAVREAIVKTLAALVVGQMNEDQKVAVRETGADPWRDGLGQWPDTTGWTDREMRTCLREIERLCAAEVAR